MESNRDRYKAIRVLERREKEAEAEQARRAEEEGVSVATLFPDSGPSEEGGKVAERLRNRENEEAVVRLMKENNELRDLIWEERRQKGDGLNHRIAAQELRKALQGVRGDIAYETVLKHDVDLVLEASKWVDSRADG